jgi:hypothetical protein
VNRELRDSFQIQMAESVMELAPLEEP